MTSLKCVKFPGDGSYQSGFPKTLYEYMKVMTHIDYAIRKGIPLHQYEPLQRFDAFCSDYKPWTRMLSTFVNQHLGGVPDFTKPHLYGKFISECHRHEKLVLDPDHLQQNILTRITF
jgi:hypothetical protein